MLTRKDIKGLLIELGARLERRGIEARLFLVGGAAMALAFARDRITRHLDAVFESKKEIYDEAAKMAREHGLPDTWLNDGVKGLLPDRSPPLEGQASFVAPGIRVGVASADYLFAMTAAAARQETDGEDLRYLAVILGLTNTSEALALADRFYGPDRLTMKTQLIVEDIFS